MRSPHLLLALGLAGFSQFPAMSQAAGEDVFLAPIQSSTEQTMGHGRSALWTLPLVATQYQPTKPGPTLQAALMAQQEGRFLDALILLDEESKRTHPGDKTPNELDLLHASFLLQGYQSRQALEKLTPLFIHPQHTATAQALAAMAYLQLGLLPEALDAAQQASKAQDSLLPHLAHSYALQALGRLAEARQEMRDCNAHHPGAAIALAREAELALTLDQIQMAKALATQARAINGEHPYIIAVSGLVSLIDGDAGAARAAFETALKRDPKDAKTLFGLGLAEIKLGNFAAGQEKLQTASEIAPGNALILTYLGRAQQNLGQTAAARTSWRSAQQADPKDPVPWLYQAQMELQANQPQDAYVSLQQAHERLSNRAVYRGERLLKEDAQLLQTNLAEIQRQLGQEQRAFQTLNATIGNDSAASLRNQAELLQGQRFAESARRSLLLQSLFNETPGNLPTTLDIYGDSAGLTGAGNPQRGAIRELSAAQASYNNYDGLFNRDTRFEAEISGGSKSSATEQVRLGAGNGTLGIGMAQLQFKTDGFTPSEHLDNRVFQGVMQWRPLKSTQVFVAHQTYHSTWGALFYPGLLDIDSRIADDSQITRLGVRHDLNEDGSRALWALFSTQETDQIVDYVSPWPFQIIGSSSAHSEELQYRQRGASYATQWGIQHNTINTHFSTGGDNSRTAQQVYAAWQQTLGPQWQIDATLGWGKIYNRDNTGSNSTYLKRWLPKLGVIYTPNPTTHLRFAAWRGLGSAGIGDATLEPVSLVGILLNHPDDLRANGRQVEAYAIGFDRQLSPAWLLNTDIKRRRISEPTMNGTPPQQVLLQYQTDEMKFGLHWQPVAQPWSVGLVYDYERQKNDPGLLSLDSVHDQTLRSQQLRVGWFASTQCTLNVDLSHNQVTGSQQTWAAPLPYRNHFNQVDASLNWKLSPAGVQVTAGVRNAADTQFQYTEIDKLSPRFSTGRLLYAKIKLSW